VPPGVPVTSPTFVLHTQYRGRLELEHLDAYRLRDAVDVGSLGFEDCFTPQSVVAIEWPEFLGDVLPAEHLAVTFELGGADERLLRLAARPAGAPAAAPLLAAAREHPGAQPPSDAPA
jgi:tRNA threonylcarbamoyladenosine biosynthesis protein TsaE